jgi:hypothetical protein
MEGKRSDARFCGDDCRRRGTLAANRVRCRRHYAKNAEAMRARSKQWRKDNPETVRAGKRRAYRKSPGKARDQLKAWKEANPVRAAEARAAWVKDNSKRLVLHQRSYKRRRASRKGMKAVLEGIELIDSIIKGTGGSHGH